MPLWDEISDNPSKGRKILGNIWREMGLVRTADFIENKTICPLKSARILFDRLSYVTKDNPAYLELYKKSNKSPTLEFLYDGDEEFLEETNFLIDQKLIYVTFEGKQFRTLIEFGSMLLKIVNQQIISQDFKMRSIGLTKFIVGFTQQPPLDNLEEKLGDYRLSIATHKEVLTMISTGSEKTSGIVYFKNNADIEYGDVQNAVALFKPETKSLVKRILIKKALIILFVPTEKICQSCQPS